MQQTIEEIIDEDLRMQIEWESQRCDLPEYEDYEDMVRADSHERFLDIKHSMRKIF